MKSYLEKRVRDEADAFVEGLIQSIREAAEELVLDLREDDHTDDEIAQAAQAHKAAMLKLCGEGFFSESVAAVFADDVAELAHDLED